MGNKEVTKDESITEEKKESKNIFKRLFNKNY